MLTFTKSSKLIKLFEARNESLIENSLIIHNKDDTFFRPNVRSKIDHLYSNCPGKINNIKTTSTGFSDHCLISWTYNTKINNLAPKFAFQREKYLLTKFNLTNYFENNHYINEVFKW